MHAPSQPGQKEDRCVRFPRETVAAIHDSGSTPITVRWPAGEEPQKGRVYYLASQEEAKAAREKAEARREYSPETHAEVMAQMHKVRYDKFPDGYKPKKRRRPTRRPSKGDARIKVLDIEILEKGWNATVALYEDPNPRTPLRVNAVVPAGLHPIHGYQEKVETEPDQIIVPQTRREREDEEESLKVESAASADLKEVARLERRVAEQKRNGKPSRKTEQALKRAKKRVRLSSAAALV
jgi:hypothetical protein